VDNTQGESLIYDPHQQSSRDKSLLVSVVKREILIALLDLTRGEPVAKGNLRAAVRVTGEVLEQFLDQLSFEGLITQRSGLLEASQKQRLDLAVRAIQLGADFERVCRALGWLEFEEMVSYVFEENGYRVLRRFRFTTEERRREIDVLAIRHPLLICGECKHWVKGLGNAAAKKIVETHLEKTRVFSESIAKIVGEIGLRSWRRAIIIPVALSLMPAPMRLYMQVPVVHVLELPSFLSELGGHLDRLIKFTVELPHSKPRPSQTVLRRRWDTSTR